MRERRKRFKVQDAGVSDIVSELLQKGHTYEAIAEHLKTLGVTIGESSIRRFNDDLQRKLEKVARTREAANALGALFKEKTGEDMDSDLSDMTIALMQQLLIDKATEDKISTRDAVGLSIGASTLVKSKAALEKLKESERKRARKAWETVMQEAKNLLEKSGLWPQVEAVLARGMKEATDS